MNTLRKNFVYQTLYQILIILLPLITAPYIARVLGAENSGIYSYCNTIATYFVVFGNLGIEQYGNRSIARVRDNKESLSKMFSELMLFHIITSVTCVILYIIYILCFSGSYKRISLIEMIYVVSAIFDINWLYFGLEKFKLTVIRNTIIKVASVILIFVSVKTQNDLNIYTTIMAGSVLLSQLALLPMLFRYVQIKNVRLSDLKKHALPMCLLFVAVIAANLNRVIDKAMLGWYGYIKDLGCYDYADRIIRMPLGLIAALGTVMLSKMSNLYAMDNKDSIKKILNASEIIIVIVSIASAFGLAAISPDFITLYLGDQYTTTSILIPILALSIPLVGWNNFVRTQLLIPKQMDSIYTKAVLIGAIVNILINIFAIKFFSAYGAAIATVISYLIITIIQTSNVRNDIQLSSVFHYIPLQAMIGLCMFIIVRLISHINCILAVRVIIELIVGALIYIVLTLVYLEFTHKEILNTFRIRRNRVQR